MIEAMMFIVVLGTSIWAATDAYVLGSKHIFFWVFFCLLFWIIGFPCYLAMRTKIREDNWSERY